MSEYTVLRIRVGAGVAARVLGAIPGISVVDDLDAAIEGRADAAAGAGTASETSPASRSVDTTTSEQFASEEAFEPAEEDEESTSAVKKWGLLGAGVTFVVVGLGTVGFWFLKRRGSDDDGGGDPIAETPPPATDTSVASTERTGSRRDATTRGKSVGADDDGMSETDSDADTETDAGTSASSADETSASTVLGEEADEAGGRSHTQSYVGPTKGVGGDDAGATAGEPEISADEQSVRTPGSINVAPLLGVAFLAVSGAIVRWMRSGRGDER